MIKFFQWLYDIVIKHNYWYSETKVWGGTQSWGEAVRIPNSPLVVKIPGNKVTKKKCKQCGKDVWSNNNDRICGKLTCWLKGV